MVCPVNSFANQLFIYRTFLSHIHLLQIRYQIKAYTATNVFFFFFFANQSLHSNACIFFFFALDVTANGCVSFFAPIFFFVFFVFSIKFHIFLNPSSTTRRYLTVCSVDHQQRRRFMNFRPEYFKLCAYFLHHRCIFSVSEVKSHNSAALHGIFPRLSCKPFRDFAFFCV